MLMQIIGFISVTAGPLLHNQARQETDQTFLKSSSTLESNAAGEGRNWPHYIFGWPFG